MKLLIKRVLLLFVMGVAWATTGIGCGGDKPQIRVPVLDQATWVHEVPVGELTDNVRVRQPVVLSEDLVNQDWSIGVMFATYARPNEGVVELALEQDTRRHVFLDSAALKDNEMAYLDVPAGDFHAGAATIVVRGIGGMPQKSPTAWTYAPTDGSPTFLLNGQAQDKRLCFTLYAFEDVE